jgi:hypothetical protein
MAKKEKVRFEILGKEEEITIKEWGHGKYHRFYVTDGKEELGYYDAHAQKFMMNFDGMSPEYCKIIKIAIVDFVTHKKEEERSAPLSLEEIEKQFDEAFDLFWDWCEGHDNAPFAFRRERGLCKIVNVDTRKAYKKEGVIVEGRYPMEVYKKFLKIMENPQVEMNVGGLGI